VTEPTELGIEQPVEDVLEQQREGEEEPVGDLPADPPPEEVDEADYVDQHIEVPVEEDRYPGGSG
jgi:hypothetical protein